MSESYTFAEQPWFIYPAQDFQTRRVVIIGGGLAGCQSAYALARRGYQVTLIERQVQLAQAASGNRAGVIYGKFSAHHSAQYAFYQQSYLHALEHIRMVMGAGNGRDWQDCGVLQLAHSEAELKLQRALQAQQQWPEAIMRHVSAEQASALAGTRIDHPALFFPQAGWLSPPALCAALVQHANISVRTHSEALQLQPAANGWQIQLAGQPALQAEIVLIANAADARQFAPSSHLPLKRIRGQVSHIAAPVHNPESSPAHNKPLGCVVCHKGYITPANPEGFYSVGATFNLKDEDTALRSSDHHSNFQHLHEYLPALAATLALEQHPDSAGRVGFRCQTPDYLPIVGPLPRESDYRAQYQHSLTGLKHARLPAGCYYRGLFVNLAHGSRGITSTGLAAEILASYIDNAPCPVSEEVRRALHPARFIVRALKRRQ